jgi:hypothetical protein
MFREIWGPAMFNFMKRRAFKKAFKEATKDGVLSKAEMRSLGEHDVDQAYVNSVRTEHYLKETAKNQFDSQN